MSFCRECGNESIDANSLFCRHCGAKLEMEPEIIEAPPVAPAEGKCAKCGAVNESGAVFCYNCGAKRDENAVAMGPVAAAAPIPAKPAVSQQVRPAVAQNTAPPPQKQAKPKKKHTGLIVFLIFLLLLIVCAGGVSAYAFLNGPETLPVIGQFFAKDTSDLEDETEKDETENDETENDETEKDETEKAAPKEEKATSEATELPVATEPAKAAPAGTDFVSATSELPGYLAENIVDGRNDTAWASEMERSGVWGSVTIPFGSDLTLYGINIKNGCWKSQFELIRNSRAKELMLKFDDGSIETLTVSDPTLSDFSALTASDGEMLLFAQPHTSSTITLTVLDAYQGAESEVYITGVSVILTPDVLLPDAAPEQFPAEPQGPVAIFNSDILYVQASSVLRSQAGRSYGAENLLDGNDQTVWSEGVGGVGAGEWIELVFARTLTLNGVEIFNGHSGSRTLFDSNGKALSVRIAFSDGSWIDRNLATNLFDYETILFDRPVTTDSLSITVLSAAAGTRYEDTCISEIRLITGIMTGDYILPFSSARMLTDADLRYLSKDELRLARNEIYARYGRQFVDNELQAFFNTKAWYISLPKLPPGVEPTPTKLELTNIDLIKKYEER